MAGRLCYVLSHPLVERDFVRFGIKMLAEAGYNIDVIDACDLFFPNRSRQFLQKQVDCNLDVSVVSHIKELLLLLSKYSAQDAVVVISSEGHVLNKIVSFLNSRKIPVASMLAGVVPIPTVSAINQGLIRWRVLFARNNIIDLTRKLYARAKYYFSSFLYKPQLDYFFYGGSKAFDNAAPVFKDATNVISVHALDYDHFLSDQEDIGCDDIIVFLDQYLPHHPDVYLASGHYAGVSTSIVDSYYKQLNSLFDFLEKGFGLKVVVAAHPRSDYVDQDPRFKGREVVRDSTLQLIKKSRFCLTYNSASVNYAVMCQKPIVLLYSDLFEEFVGEYDRAIGLAMAQELGKTYMKMDGKLEFLPDLSVDELAYSAYLERYVRDSRSESDALFWEVVARQLSNDIDEMPCLL